MKFKKLKKIFLILFYFIQECSNINKDYKKFNNFSLKFLYNFINFNCFNECQIILLKIILLKY